MRILNISLMVLTIGLSAATWAKASELRAVAANLPPYAIEDGAKGFNLELSRLAAERAGYTLEVEFLPWKRAQKMVQEADDLLAFNLTRTEKREPLYKWITPLIEYSNVFVTTTTSIDTFETAAERGETLARSGTPQERRISGSGIPYREIGSPEQAVRMLDAGRASAWFTHDRRAEWVWKQEKRSNQLVLGASQGSGTIYLAASPNFPADKADALRAAVEELRADGTYDALMEKYFGPVR
ncbi:substrate-binding periplasmic protein [Pseudaestuariivita rosea]|uniref:substrate-binding periplasmic protein n=1 Tax=Pseudaestuariivita rosea TaxID=2763263 RepID=UPI001ABBCBB5|nr:transporter substrate-binding domain-containing protein [Pseudaestuariivita rosea]